MVLLVPKAFAKQIMCINTRKIEVGRGVSGKERGAKKGPKTSLLVEGEAKKPQALGRKKKPPFPQKSDLELAGHLSILLAFSFLEKAQTGLKIQPT